MAKPQELNLRCSPIMLSEVKAGETIPTKIQIIRCGTFIHPADGKKFEITPEILLSLKKNHDDNVMGVDAAIDFSHASEAEAAAWIMPKGLELRENGTQLWGEVDWTRCGAESVSGKEFRYISADITMNFVNNETKKGFGPTLRGAALTNRPVIKSMSPVIELSEIGSEISNKENSVEEKDKKIAELEAQIAEMKKAMEAKDVELSDKAKKLGEIEASDKAAKELAEKEKQLSEKKAKFDVLLSEGKAVEAQRAPFMEDNFLKFAEMQGSVKTSPAGDIGNQDDGTKKAEDEILELAQKKVKDSGMKIGDAMSLVLSENPTLRERYEKGT